MSASAELPPLLFATSAYQAMADKLLELGDYELGEVEVKHFPDGERYQRICTEVRQRSILLLGGTHSDSATLELFDLGCALVKYGAKSLSLVLPYYGYSTMERALKPGEVVTAKTRARLLSSIPEAAFGNQVVVVDTHSEGIPHYFEAGITPYHVYAKPIVLAAARDLGGDDFVLACTDAGRAKWVESLANDLGVPAAFIFKRRLDGERTEVTAISASVGNKSVVIYDDMIRTGGSLIGAAKAYRAAGATHISAIATHGIFPNNAVERLRASGLFDRVVATDSHPNATPTADGFLEIRSIAPLLHDLFTSDFFA